MVAVTSLVESSLGCMKLHYPSGGLGANSGGAHSLRPAGPPSSFMGGFFLSLALCHGVDLLELSIFPQKEQRQK